MNSIWVEVINGSPDAVTLRDFSLPAVTVTNSDPSSPDPSALVDRQDEGRDRRHACTGRSVRRAPIDPCDANDSLRDRRRQMGAPRGRSCAPLRHMKNRSCAFSAEWLHQILRSAFDKQLPDADPYDRAFDRAEVMLGVVSEDEGIIRATANPQLRMAVRQQMVWQIRVASPQRVRIWQRSRRDGGRDQYPGRRMGTVGGWSVWWVARTCRRRGDEVRREFQPSRPYVPMTRQCCRP